LLFGTLLTKVYGVVPYPQQGARQPPTCILDSFNKFLEVLIDELPNALLPCREVEHKIKMVFGATLPSKAPYRLKQKEL
jgi:hypothetical protein